MCFADRAHAELFTARLGGEYSDLQEDEPALSCVRKNAYGSWPGIEEVELTVELTYDYGSYYYSRKARRRK